MKQLFVATAFKIDAPQDLTVAAFSDDQHPLIPKHEPDYIFRKDILRDLLAFINDPMGDALYLTGPTGSGKTSVVCQVLARLNYPTHRVPCHGRLEFNDLVGQFMLCNGSMRFVHGPLSIAIREGHILLLNEIDRMDPSELVGLNDIIEGQPLLIPQNGGEVIKPHPHFRLIATANSAGQGDQSGYYQGVMQQDLAFMDRFRMTQVDYATPDVETNIINETLRRLGVTLDASTDLIVQNMIKVANDIRKIFLGGASEKAVSLSLTMSTRTLVRWMALMVNFKRAPNALEYSLDRALTFRAELSQREAIHQIAKNIFGDTWRSSNQGF